MKEIDFLPEWYKSGKRRQVSYKTQYLAIGAVFLVMMAWSYITTCSLSKARSQIIQMAAKQTEAEEFSGQLADLENEIEQLNKKSELIKKIDSKIDVASVLAEMSFLIGEKIVMKKTEFIAEKVKSEKVIPASPDSGTVVRAVRENKNKKNELPLGNVRFKIILAGIAADARDVATLMCQLEDSQYFNQVVLSYSRGDAKININRALFEMNTTASNDTSGSGKPVLENENMQVNEFEIHCYLANYREL